jgi:alcohol dehydrogenase class IV
MSELQFQGIERVLFGMDSIEGTADLVRPLGKRVLLVTEQTGKDKDSFLRLQSILRAGGIDPVVFDDIRPGIKTSVIETIADIGKAGKIQTVIALGGMRVLSVARVATVLIGSDAGLNEILLGSAPKQLQCAYVEVPNSCRNHFMMKDSCVISDSVSERAKYISLPPGMTKAVVIDPSMSMGLSTKYQLVAIMDTLLASIEGYLSAKKNFLSDIHLIEAIARLRKALTLTFRRSDDLSARRLASEGGLLSALGLATSSQGIGGTLAYMINAAFQVPKSWIAMVLLPHILDMYLEREPERLGRIADALGEDISGVQSEQAAPRAAVAVRRVLAQLELPTRLRDFNLSLTELSGICESAADFPLNQFCGLALSADEVCELVKKAF